MLDLIKRKLREWYNKEQAKVQEANRRKYHYRPVGKEEQRKLSALCVETPIFWSRGNSRKSYYFFPDDTIKLVKAKTGMTLTYLSGEWFEVTRHSNTGHAN